MNVSLRKQSFYIHYADGESTHKMRNPHIHNDYEIYLQMEGQRYFMISGKQYKITKHQLVLINPNILHQTRDVLGAPHQRYVVNFHADFVPKEEMWLIHRLLQNEMSILHVPSTNINQVQSIMDQMLKEYRNEKEDSKLFIRSLLTQLLIICYRMKGEALCVKSQHDKERHVPDLLKYIHNHFHHNLSLHKLSEVFHLNEHYISRIFKRETGYGFVEYVNHLRITEAERLLKETDLPIQQISHRIGYSTQVHFNRVFKTRKGISPKQYRQQSRT